MLSLSIDKPTLLLSDASESLTSTKSLINPEWINSSVIPALPQETTRLKLNMFHTSDRLPDFANVAYTLIKSL